MRLMDRLVGVFNLLAEIACALMMITICADVLARNVFNVIIEAGAETVAYYFMVSLAYFPLAAITRDDAHLQASFFTARLAPHVRAKLEGGVALLLGLFMAMLTWQSVIAAIDKTQAGEITQAARTNLPIWPARWILPIGASLMAAYALAVGLRKLSGLAGAAEDRLENV
jgi:TRAP-type C4-dicarboxylate transport system permease small subunit